MATWIECTRDPDNTYVLLNIDTAVSLERHVRNSTLIVYPFHTVQVKESVDEILKRARITHA
ncbi:MAG: hypothetical protein AB7U75_10260 [Hyphomicrobiaceae bacterium]